MAKPPLTIAHQRTPPTKALISTNRTPLGGINFSKVASPWHGAFATQNGNPSTLLPKNYQRLYSDTTSTNPLTLSTPQEPRPSSMDHTREPHIYSSSAQNQRAHKAQPHHTLFHLSAPSLQSTLSLLDSVFACSSLCLGRSSGS
jgi:hypothetical protein